MKRELFAAAAMLALVASAPEAMAQVYLRLDGGGAFSANTALEDTNPTAFNAGLGFNTPRGDAGTSPLGSAGVGYRFSPSFRMDLTGTYVAPLNFSGTDPFGGIATAKIKPLYALLNGYIDFAGLAGMPASGVQPFLVFGLGASHTQLDTITLTGVGGTLTINGHKSTEFAWGIGAGVGFPLGRVVTLDLMYKYVDLGNAQSGTQGVFNGVTLPPATASQIGIQLHEVTAGLRLEF